MYWLFLSHEGSLRDSLKLYNLTVSILITLFRKLIKGELYSMQIFLPVLFKYYVISIWQQNFCRGWYRLVTQRILYKAEQRNGWFLEGSRKAFMRWKVFALSLFSLICHLSSSIQFSKSVFYPVVDTVYAHQIFMFSPTFPSFLCHVIGFWLMCIEVM